MTALKAVTRMTLGEQVALQLAEMIAQAHWAPGTKLPAEAALCKSLNVGRSTLREALKSLAFIGMLHMRPGDGTYVAEDYDRLLDRVKAKGLLKTEKDLTDVCETRVLLETELAALAAKRATARDRSRLKALCVQMQASAAGNGKPYAELDLEFHLAIADASHNNLLRRLLIDIRELLIDWIGQSQEFPGGFESAQQHHARILKNILEGNAEGARREMMQHIETLQTAYKLLGLVPPRARKHEEVLRVRSTARRR
jgi:GntR family transcriptional repressor for pyruvate dehydrogenase complex